MSRRNIDARPKMRRTIDSYHHGDHLVARAPENSSIRRRMAGPLDDGVFGRVFFGAKELITDGP